VRGLAMSALIDQANATRAKDDPESQPDANAEAPTDPADKE